MGTNTRAQVLARFGSIAPAERGGRRAAHKALLLLWALGRLQQQRQAVFEFVEAEAPVDALLSEWGPPWRTTALYPFWHLQTDGVWQVEKADDLPRRKGKDRPTLQGMRLARGGFPPDLAAALEQDRTLLVDAALLLLEAHFEHSLHAPISSAVGLDLGVIPAKRRRDPQFRARVLTAYEYRCAVCDWSVFVGRDPLGLDAAHLQWHALGGDDSLENGLCLCSIHHIALDRGALAVTDDRRILVSAEVHAGSPAGALLIELSGQLLRAPQPGMAAPAVANVTWHREQVFRGPARSFAY